MPRAGRVTSASSNNSELFDYPSPDELNLPPEDFEDYIMMIFGPKGGGKSTAAASAPDSLTLMLEPMRRGLKIRQLNVIVNPASKILEGQPDVWKQIIATTPKWLDDPTVKRLNFDSMDLTYEACYHSICASHRISAPGDAGRGSADIWNEIRDEFASYFNALRESDMRLTFISHVKERDESTLEGSKMGVASPSCSPACLKFVKQAADIVLYYGWYNSKRAMMVRDTTNAAFVAPGVEGKFLQPDGKPLYIFEIPDIREYPDTNIHSVIKSAFNNELWDIDTPEDERIVSTPKPKPTPKPPVKRPAGPPRK
jgi:hypothetical protein